MTKVRRSKTYLKLEKQSNTDLRSILFIWSIGQKRRGWLARVE